jgi:hypothetical protein
VERDELLDLLAEVSSFAGRIGVRWALLGAGSPRISTATGLA